MQIKTMARASTSAAPAGFTLIELMVFVVAVPLAALLTTWLVRLVWGLVAAEAPSFWATFAVVLPVEGFLTVRGLRRLF